MLNTLRPVAIAAAFAGALGLGALPARAEHGRHAAAAAGAIGGLAAGAAIAGALNRPAPYYPGPAGYEVYEDEPVYAPSYGCHWERRQVYIDTARYLWKRVRVCD